MKKAIIAAVSAVALGLALIGAGVYFGGSPEVPNADSPIEQLAAGPISPDQDGFAIVNGKRQQITRDKATGHINRVSFSDDTFILPADTQVKQVKDNAYIIKGDYTNLTNEKSFVAYFNTVPNAFVAKSAEYIDGWTYVTTVEDDSAFVDADFQTEVELDFLGEDANAEFVPNYHLLSLGGATAESEKSNDSKHLDAVVTIYDDGTGLSYEVMPNDYLRVFCSFENIGPLPVNISGDYVEYGIEYDLEYGISIEGDMSERASLGLDGGEFEIGSIRIYGIGEISVSLVFSAEGSAELKSRHHLKMGEKIAAGDSAPKPEFSSELIDTEVAATGKASVSVKTSIGIGILNISGDAYVKIDFVGEAELLGHGDHPVGMPDSCSTLDFYIEIIGGAEAACSFGANLVFHPCIEVVLLTTSDSPMFTMHVEDGKLVDCCAYDGKRYNNDSVDLTPTRQPQLGDTVLDDIDGYPGLPIDLRITDILVLDRNLNIPGDLYIGSAATVDLNGYTLDVGGMIIPEGSGSALNINGGVLETTGNVVWPRGIVELGDGGVWNIAGDLHLQDGALRMGSGALSVGGDLIVRGSEKDGGGRYLSYAKLEMAEAGARIDVAGDFGWDGNHSWAPSAGTLQVGGDVTLDNGYGGASFCPARDGSFSFVLAGDNPSRTVSIVRSGDGLGRLIVEHPENQIAWAGYLGRLEMTGDLTVLAAEGLASTSAVWLGGHELSVEGGLRVAGDLNLQDGTLSVSGNLDLQDGTVKMGSGLLSVDGDLVVRGPADGSGGRYLSYAGLVMDEAGAAIRVAGDFVWDGNHSWAPSAGAIEVGGDVTLLNGSNPSSFLPARDGSFSFVIAGDNPSRTVSIVRSGDGLGRLVVEHPENQIAWAGYLGRLEMTGDLTVLAAEGLASTSAVWLGGHELSVEGGLRVAGDLHLQGGTLSVAGDLHLQDGALRMGSGELCVGGDLSVIGGADGSGGHYLSYAGLVMDEAGARIAVAGDFVWDGNHSWAPSAGAIEVGGDVTVSNGFRTVNECVVILGGQERQSISVGEEVKLSCLVLEQGIGNYTFNRYWFWDELRCKSNVYGDVNLDSVLDVRDLVLLQRSLAGYCTIDEAQMISLGFGESREAQMKDLVALTKTLLAS